MQINRAKQLKIKQLSRHTILQENGEVPFGPFEVKAKSMLISKSSRANALAERKGVVVK